MLIAQDLVKLFPGVRALDKASLRIEPGSVHALLGENGAGKSTLIKILTGVYRPDGGTLSVGGEEVHLDSPQAASRAGVGVVHQERNLVPEFSIGENIVLQRLPAKGGLLDRAAIRAEARRCLDLLELDLDPDRRVRGLPVSQLQLIEVAKALSMNSSVLLLDEPTTASTPSEVERLFDVIRKLRDNGTAVLFVSHKLEEVYELCDTVTVLRDGVSVLESKPLTELAKQDLITAMVGRAHSAVDLPARPAVVAEPVLELAGVSTAIGHHDVSLSLRPGEILGLYGLVGAGRSELAKAVLGLSAITSGEVRVRGKAVRIKDVRDALRTHRVGYVPEDRKEEGLFLDQPVTRNIAVAVWDRLSKRFGGVSAKRERELAETYVERLGIRLSSTDKLVGELSGGNQQKVSLAKWLAAETGILIIDEPTVGIDVRTKAAFHELIWQLATDGLAVLLITSDLVEMVTLADRIVVMRDFHVCGEVVNDHDYEPTSHRVMGLIHQDAE
ncbi:sugar ABC transporter ATP-binding protein [Umezawaea sp. Da 62-37]|uniref:sugar ABC transporter ATP-binding protein n=1 Tax=Umezawaea sp. Da 62-37 TaxID=3075927 RepID=UPI0028F72850|nr:sugar ABC transporter ATP-binding protein [Umezawaea sp. Da 62-37]WNV82696.1 sugar ABC transporter ATP-binding protein [Umezawaea sp. Da 62-37]